MWRGIWVLGVLCAVTGSADAHKLPPSAKRTVVANGRQFVVTIVPREAKVEAVNSGRSRSLKSVQSRLTTQGKQVWAVSTSLFHTGKRGASPIGANIFDSRIILAQHRYRRWWLAMPKRPGCGVARFTRRWDYLVRHRADYDAIEMGAMILPGFESGGFPRYWCDKVTDRMAIGYNRGSFFVIKGKGSVWDIRRALKKIGCTYAGLTDGGHSVAAAPYHLAFVSPR